MGGMFLETTVCKPVGAVTSLEFLVQEGLLKADAVVQHVASDRGLGLRFTAMSEADHPHLVALMIRLGESPISRENL
jgi:hypothetical protein